MKANRVPARRRRRGLRRVRGAEPPVVGLTPQTTNEWKANTMKTYLLRQPKPVQPQKSLRSPRPQPAAPAATGLLLGRPDATAPGPILFLGLGTCITIPSR